MTRSQRYAEVNGILYARSNTRNPIAGHFRMYAAEMNDFERWCPEFDELRDNGEREKAVETWRGMKEVTA